MERHRLQRYALSQVAALLDDRQPVRILHIAPEKSISGPLRELGGRGGVYVTGDLSARDVDLHVDLREMSQFSDGSWDLIWASHVMEHIDDDAAAIAEIERVLSPSGVAVLPVPINADSTVEYGAPCEADFQHVRAPGLDYFDRYRRAFRSVSVVTSADAPSSIQPWVIEDRTVFPTKALPDRPPQSGQRHIEAVPICSKSIG
jgi:SAM-dependent methyltransferase